MPSISVSVRGDTEIVGAVQDIAALLSSSFFIAALTAQMNKIVLPHIRSLVRRRSGRLARSMKFVQSGALSIELNMRFYGPFQPDIRGRIQRVLDQHVQAAADAAAAELFPGG